MEKQYWMARQRSAMALARGAASGDARLIHYDMAGRYGIKAAGCLPFMLPTRAPATEGERAALHRPPPSAPTRPGRASPHRRDPDGPAGERR